MVSPFPLIPKHAFFFIALDSFANAHASTTTGLAKQDGPLLQTYTMDLRREVSKMQSNFTSKASVR